ncbi:MAG: NAD(P)H-dependent oxidoreductase [Arenicellales bacterium]
MALKLQTIICSTRPGRVGPAVARWFHEFAVRHAGFDCELIDLADFDLPVLDEPNHPRLQKYQNEHTKRWSASVTAADAYVFVTPEYNYGPSPAFVNAIDYVYKEWNYKPCGFVSYGGISGGLRAVQLERLLVTTLKMMPMMEGVPIPRVANQLDPDGNFVSNETIDGTAKTMLDELLRWAQGLREMRERMA